MPAHPLSLILACPALPMQKLAFGVHPRSPPIRRRASGTLSRRCRKLVAIPPSKSAPRPPDLSPPSSVNSPSVPSQRVLSPVSPAVLSLPQPTKRNVFPRECQGHCPAAGEVTNVLYRPNLFLLQVILMILPPSLDPSIPSIPSISSIPCSTPAPTTTTTILVPSLLFHGTCSSTYPCCCCCC